MCNPNSRDKKSKNLESDTTNSADSTGTITSRIRVADNESDNMPQRRGKRVKQSSLPLMVVETKNILKSRSSLRKKHEDDSKSGGIEAILPSLGIVIVLAIALVAKSGWRGRSTVAGVDLGTTNSVICIQQQSKGAEVGEIECIPDPFNNSPVVPSVVSFLDPHHQYVRIDKEDVSSLDPHPTHAVVGAAAKARIDSHPHHTLYHAKRILGRSFDDQSVTELQNEVEFEIVPNNTDVAFKVPFHKDTKDGKSTQSISVPPHRVGSYVVHHLMKMASDYLGHRNVKSAVIAVPAKFDQAQIEATAQAFKDAGISVARILEEPVAAALAYGLQKKENVDYILVYDFGGGTLDVSMLQVFDGGYVEVMGNDGDNHLGGADFDAAVVHSLLEGNNGRGAKIVDEVSKALKNIEHHLDEGNELGEEDIEEMLSAQCIRLTEMPLCTISSFHTIGEKMKIALSSQASEMVDSTCFGLNAQEHLPQSISSFCTLLKPMKLSLTLDQYNHASKSLFDRSSIPIRRLLKDLDLESDDIDEVVMVGGTTQMPQIREMVKAELKIENLNTSIDPDLTVAYGAASVID